MSANNTGGITTSTTYISPFKDLPYTPKNWYLSVFKNKQGKYNISIRPLLNTVKQK
jgi:hypothetical protein